MGSRKVYTDSLRLGHRSRKYTSSGSASTKRSMTPGMVQMEGGVLARTPQPSKKKRASGTASRMAW